MLKRAKEDSVANADAPRVACSLAVCLSLLLLQLPSACCRRAVADAKCVILAFDCALVCNIFVGWGLAGWR